MMEINHYTDSRMNIYTQFMTTAFGAGMGIKQVFESTFIPAP